jgi:hypothetical protein
VADERLSILRHGQRTLIDAKPTVAARKVRVVSYATYLTFSMVNGDTLPIKTAILPMEDVIPDAGDAKKHGTPNTGQNHHHPNPARRMRLLPRDHVIGEQ